MKSKHIFSLLYLCIIAIVLPTLFVSCDDDDDVGIDVPNAVVVASDADEYQGFYVDGVYYQIKSLEESTMVAEQIGQDYKSSTPIVVHPYIKLTSKHLPKKYRKTYMVTTIQQYFCREHASILKCNSISIPETVILLRKESFHNNGSEYKGHVYFHSLVPPKNDDGIRYGKYAATVHVPKAALNAYREAWGDKNNYLIGDL